MFSQRFYSFLFIFISDNSNEPRSRIAKSSVTTEKKSEFENYELPHFKLKSKRRIEMKKWVHEYLNMI